MRATGIELFAGCGGASTGFLDAGLRVSAGFDSNASAVEVYDYNHRYRGSRGVKLDLSLASGDDLLAAAQVERIDFLLGGPPCQPFSIAGKRRGSTDDRSTLLDHYVRLVSQLKPAAILFENVPNLLTIERGSVFERFVNGLRELGYDPTWAVLSAADFGVAQNRRRLILLATASKLPQLQLPSPTHGSAPLLGLRPIVTSREAIEDLPDAGEFGKSGVFNHQSTMHSLDMLERFSNLQIGKRDKASFHDRLHPDRPSYTLRAGNGNFSPLRPVHYRYDRVVTVRESARLQSFSDAFIWPDSIPRLQQYRQVGNAIPPLLSKAVAIAMASQLDWTLSPEDFVGNPNARAWPITKSDDESLQSRQNRIRGASLGKQSAAATSTRL